MKSNFERMIQMAEEIFDTGHDETQLQVDQDVIHHLQQLHPSSVTELDEGQGPIVWILLIPTMKHIMQEFLDDVITEQELLNQTPLHQAYDALYLCSAMVLDEYRHQGLASKLTLKAIEEIRESHPVKTLFVWPFSKGGEQLALKIATASGLPLRMKERI